MLPIILLIFLASLVASSLCVYQKVSKRWLVGSGSGHEVECVVCLSKICKGEKLRSLPICHHSFHLDCIDSWLRVRPTCPLCRISVAPERNFLIASLLSLAKRLGKWVENPLYLELRTVVCESFGYI
ncbi:hypothetical protein Gogos_008050 [Gossypium gossypioides]|uniref:RING-type E3 ubiquitin transferase n=1 Tax=Gossypium gossypioides TaxID=34282 RepID=A0A7J9CBB3_GOSGO|nr:hypothetical protein [Gossypium gossypioides]